MSCNLISYVGVVIATTRHSSVVFCHNHKLILLDFVSCCYLHVQSDCMNIYGDDKVSLHKADLFPKGCTSESPLQPFLKKQRHAQAETF